MAMMKNKSFAVFILSHGRPFNIRTLRSLLKVGGYSGDWYIVIDNEDDTAYEYIAKYKEHVIVFDKEAISKTFDTFDNFKERRTVVFARNACFDIAQKLGIACFLELDDDYLDFLYRYKSKDGVELRGTAIKQLDRLFDAMIDFLYASGASTVALAQGGDFIGGIGGAAFDKKIMRKAMNTFFCRTDRRFDFVGRINEDVNTYVSGGIRGELYFTITDACIVQVQTQKQTGGMSDAYLDCGTYLKSFYTVMVAPSCVSIRSMGPTNKRLHHQIRWNNCSPKILNESWRK